MTIAIIIIIVFLLCVLPLFFEGGRAAWAVVFEIIGGIIGGIFEAIFKIFD